VTIQDLGALPGGLFSRANAINDHGQIVGESQYLGAAHAVLWSVGHD
jgi:probable HAF family extracellular repeat protein